MNPIYKFFSSLRLTVLLLSLGLILIFFGTLDQVNIGINGAQQKYFENFLAIWKYPAQWPLGHYLGWLNLPIPGGYLIGPFLVLNLFVAHFRYYRRGWQKSGIVLIHAGVVLLIISQLVTNIVQEENYMWVDEGGISNYLESFSLDELVVIDKSGEGRDKVVSIPTSLLAKNKSFQNPQLPFRLKIEKYFPNSSLLPRSENPEAPSLGIDRGLGGEMDFTVLGKPKTFKQNERNAESAVVSLIGPDGTIGTWLVSTLFDENFPPQAFAYDNRRFEIALRFKRTYLPYSIELIDFKHDLYPGTQIPKNYSSLVRIKNPETGEDRQTLIYMNNPLRYEGRTFYQASFGKQDTASMFQVVRNPGWLIPYISVALVTTGLILQFGLHLLSFAGQRREKK